MVVVMVVVVVAKAALCIEHPLGILDISTSRVRVHHHGIVTVAGREHKKTIRQVQTERIRALEA